MLCFSLSTFMISWNNIYTYNKKFNIRLLLLDYPGNRVNPLRTRVCLFLRNFKKPHSVKRNLHTVAIFKTVSKEEDGKALCKEKTDSPINLVACHVIFRRYFNSSAFKRLMISGYNSDFVLRLNNTNILFCETYK